jgi:hypothetical protein
MKYRYITVYQIRGLTHSPNAGDTEIYAKGSDNYSVRAILSDRPDQYCYDMDRARSINYLTITGMVGKHGTTDEKLEIESGIERIRERRKKEMEAAEALVFIAEGDAQVDLSSSIKETNDYIVGFDIVNKDEILSLHRDKVNAALAALCLATEGVPIQVKHLSSGIYLLNEFNKPVYSIGISASGEAYTSIPTTAEIIKEAQGQLKSAGKRVLNKIYGLLSQAISRDNDELRRFMFGWAALEIFIKTVFLEYEKLFIKRLLETDFASQASRYFDSIRRVMKGKYSIADKFVVVATCLGERSVDPDLKEFIRIKKVRDALFHDTSMAEKGLPTFVIVELLKKYLRLHMKNKGRLTTPSTLTRH